MKDGLKLVSLKASSRRSASLRRLRLGDSVSLTSGLEIRRPEKGKLKPRCCLGCHLCGNRDGKVGKSCRGSGNDRELHVGVGGWMQVLLMRLVMRSEKSWTPSLLVTPLYFSRPSWSVFEFNERSLRSRHRWLTVDRSSGADGAVNNEGMLRKCNVSGTRAKLEKRQGLVLMARF